MLIIAKACDSHLGSIDKVKKILQTSKSKKLRQQLSNKAKIINLKEVSKIMKFESYNKKTLRYIVKI